MALMLLKRLDGLFLFAILILLSSTVFAQQPTREQLEDYIDQSRRNNVEINILAKRSKIFVINIYEIMLN